MFHFLLAKIEKAEKEQRVLPLLGSSLIANILETYRANQLRVAGSTLWFGSEKRTA
jgi:hypothetical protein